MSADFLAGTPIAVDPEKIERELAKLWKPAGKADSESPAVTRASLANVIVYLPDAPRPGRSYEVLVALGGRFPSRIILLTHRGPEASRSTGNTDLAASVLPVCHLPEPGSVPVCCELISLETPSGAIEAFPGAVSALLLPDLPVVLVLPGAGGDGLMDLLGSAVDRVIFDSRDAASGGLDRLRAAFERKGACGVDDLAWRDTAGWRFALSEIFDDEAARPLLGTLRRVEVRHERGSPCRAALMAGWLASRLEDRARRIETVLEEVEPAADAPGQIVAVRLESDLGKDRSHVTVERASGSSLLRIECRTEQACVLPRTIPLRVEREVELLGRAIERQTHQGVLRSAVERACTG